MSQDLIRQLLANPPILSVDAVLTLDHLEVILQVLSVRGEITIKNVLGVDILQLGAALGRRK